ncbi:MAG: tocopherol cyclase family protein [Sphaerochaetaceae bacterium]
MRDIFHSERFQGNLNRKNYFEGWYFKMVSSNGNHVTAVIPGVSLSEESPHAFIQIISTDMQKTLYFTFPLDQFSYSRKDFHIQIANSSFSSDHLHLDISQDGKTITGDLSFIGHALLPKSLLNPSIMGPFAYLPKMECNHGIVSMRHQVLGSLSIGGKKSLFDDGTGYIEKDWGTSFPSSWVWLHTNTAGDSDFSFLLSYATIPVTKKRGFNGLICFLMTDNGLYRFATYNRSKVSRFEVDKERVAITLKRKNLILDVDAVCSSSGILQSPVKGNMERAITESITSIISLSLKNRDGDTLFSVKGSSGGYEVSGF